ncbi:MAG: hypothetical protein IPL40_02075 [Proteobacteria bacterium]|nr:hypothetical protein [Pseudomonadota bacterium]
MAALTGTEPPHVLAARQVLDQVFPPRAFAGRGRAALETRDVVIEFCLRRVRAFDGDAIDRVAAEATRGAGLDLPLRALVAGLQSPVLAKVLQAAAERRRGTDPLLRTLLRDYRHNAPALGRPHNLGELRALLAEHGVDSSAAVERHATASIATVYKITPAEGPPLALKLRHAEMARLIARDRADFAVAMHTLGSSAKTRWVIEQSIGFLEGEARGSEDQRAMQLAREAYAAAKLPWAKVPELFASWDGGQLMSWAPGVHLTDLPVARRSATASRLLQVFFAPWGHASASGDSSIHCDLHPSNLLGELSPGADLPIQVLDHGLAVTLSSQEREDFAQFSRAMFGLSLNDAARAAARALAPFVGGVAAEGTILRGEGTHCELASAIEPILAATLRAHPLDRPSAIKEALMAIGSADALLLDPRVSAIGRGVSVALKAFQELGGNSLQVLLDGETRRVLAPLTQ